MRWPLFYELFTQKIYIHTCKNIGKTIKLCYSKFLRSEEKKMESSLIRVVAIAILILINAYFVALEFAIVQIRASKIDMLIQEGNKKALKCKIVKDNLNSYLSSTQLGITLVGLFLGWIGEPTVSELIGPLLDRITSNNGIKTTISFIFSFALITLLEVVFGELVPKAMALAKTEKCNLMLDGSLVIFHKLTYPITMAFDKLTALCLKPFGMEVADENQEVYTRDELEMLVNQSIDDKRDQLLLSNAFQFSDCKAEEIMIHRTKMVCIDINASQEEVVNIITNNGYTRYPIIDKEKDNIIGFVHVRDIYRDIVADNKLDLNSCIRKVSAFPEDMKIRDIFKQLKEKKEQMAIVVDEFGGTSGLLSLEDIIEELVGDIEDEFDE